MKKLLFYLLLFAGTASAFAQTSAKRYLTIEHFTNTKCPICASRNPGFYTTIAPYSADIHHLAVHPSVPYSSCALYQANIADNSARTNLYSIPGTPRLVLNGSPLAPANPLLTDAQIQPFLDDQSPLYLKVTESTVGTQRKVNIEAQAWGNIPAGNYRLFAVVTEKMLLYNAPNGEGVHHDVLRDLLPTAQGEVFTPPAQGAKSVFEYTFDIASTWKADEIYVLAFVQNMDSKEILNSGTKFDPVLVGANEVIDNQSLVIFPNPAEETARISVAGETLRSVEVFGLNGQLVLRLEGLSSGQTSVSMAGFVPGTYVIKAQGEAGVYLGKVVKI